MRNVAQQAKDTVTSKTKEVLVTAAAIGYVRCALSGRDSCATTGNPLVEAGGALLLATAVVAAVSSKQAASYVEPVIQKGKEIFNNGLAYANRFVGKKPQAPEKKTDEPTAETVLTQN